MSSSQKKVILRRFLGDVLFGYLPASAFVDQGEIRYLNLQGRVAGIPLNEVKTVCYVRDFNLNDPVSPERLQRRSFVARPRGDGLWVRILFREDGDVLEGLVAPDVSLLDGLTNDQGLFLSPAGYTSEHAAGVRAASGDGVDRDAGGYHVADEAGQAGGSRYG